MSQDYMRTPCKNCPFRTDVRPYLHPQRAEDIAHSACNPFSNFTCHETLEEHDEDLIETTRSKTCAGFLTLKYIENGESGYEDDGFVPSLETVYSDTWDMIQAYEDEWNKSNKSSN